MATIVLDQDIKQYLDEPKVLPGDYRKVVQTKPKRGHREQEICFDGQNGNLFKVVARISDSNPLDFSVILGVIIPNTSRFFRLCRYNGKSHEHTNRLESQTFYDFHIHTATERYQRAGFEEDTYATPSGKYSTIVQALDSMIIDLGFVLPEGDQRGLFDGMDRGVT